METRGAPGSNSTKTLLVLLNKVNSRFLHRPEQEFLQRPLEKAPSLRAKLSPGDGDPATQLNKATPEPTSPRISLGLHWKGPQGHLEMLPALQDGASPGQRAQVRLAQVRLVQVRLAQAPHPAEGAEPHSVIPGDKQSSSWSRRECPSLGWGLSPCPCAVPGDGWSLVLWDGSRGREMCQTS